MALIANFLASSFLVLVNWLPPVPPTFSSGECASQM